MSLAPGTRVGPYEVTGQLGSGGMGEVCRARDTKLNREVALKVLPDAFANDPDRMSRFQREAQLLAALNHPNIAAIYGLEDGEAVCAIVMELVEGATLTGPTPIEDALRIAKQIAEAIEYAHDRGIIHRDLKPANIKVTPDGAVKVLDFGLAKAMDDVSDTAAAVAGTMSPTLSLGATYAGVIMGTAAYMAPEQARGKPADRRSDIWAFGVVLYETLTGDRVFGGDSVPDTLASVIKDPIAFGKLPDDTPASIRKLVSRCLERDPRRRLQSIGEARILLEDVIAGVDVEPRTAASRTAVAPVSKWLWAGIVVSALTAAASLGWALMRSPAAVTPAVTRFTLSPPEGGTITGYRSFASQLAVSPNGHYLAYVVDEPGRERTIWVRALDSLSAQRLDRTEDVVYPFWSPDSRQIGYFAKGKLMRISVAGGAPQTVADAPDGEGGAWFQAENQDDVIVFAAGQNGPLQRVPAQGGVPTAVTTLDQGEMGHAFPEFLPDGRLLYLVRGGKSGIYAQALGSRERTFVVEARTRTLFAPPNFLLYLRDNALLAQHLNLSTLRLEGEPISIAEDVRSGGINGRSAFAVSATGVLAYRAGGSGGNAQIAWRTRNGDSAGVALDTGSYNQMALSPDGKRLAVQTGVADDRDLWVKDLVTGVFSRITSTPGPERSPVWSPDSRRLVYERDDATQAAIFETLLGSGKHTRVPSDGKQSVIFAWTPDGRFLLTGTGSNGGISLVPMPRDGESSTAAPKSERVFFESYVTSHFALSPDGKWVAYSSQDTGQPEINVATFPGFTERRQLSTAGGTQPLWRSDGGELFFIARDQKLMVMSVKSGATLEFGAAKALFQTGVGTGFVNRTYAVTPDGQRFLVREAGTAGLTGVEQLFVVTNWTSLVGP